MEFGGSFGKEHVDQNQQYEQCEPLLVCCCGGKGVPDLVFLRSIIREEVEEAMKRVILPCLQSPNMTATPRLFPPQAESPASRRLYLHIDDRFLPETLFTMNKIKHQIDSLEVELRDEYGSRVVDGPESSAKTRVVVLNGDFDVEGSDWTEEDFNRKLVQPRKDKGPLLKGNCEISLKGGVAVISDICFTDNSKRNGTVRLGVQVVKAPSGVLIKEAVSKAFTVKERRLLSDKKHETPALGDELWRLKNIRKDGPVYERAKRESICTVKDFLKLYHTDAKKLQNILKVGETKWKEIVENAEACVLTTEHCSYSDDTRGIEIRMNCVFNILSVSFWDGNTLTYESLDDHLKELVSRLRTDAYSKPTELKIYNPTDQMLMQGGWMMMQAGSPSSLPYTTELKIYNPTDQMLMQAGSPSSLPYTTNTQHLVTAAFQQGAPSLHPSEVGQLEISEGQQQYDEWFNVDQFLYSMPEEQRNPSESSIKKTPNSKLIAAFFVTKAATMFMVSIEQDQSALKKKRKFR